MNIIFRKVISSIIVLILLTGCSNSFIQGQGFFLSELPLQNSYNSPIQTNINLKLVDVNNVPIQVLDSMPKISSAKIPADLRNISFSSKIDNTYPTYLIGPGDEIIIMLWGETQFRQLLEVDREGFVFIPEIGQVFVNGLNLSLLESKLFKVFSQSYASLNPLGRTPTTFLDVSLGNLRPLRIQVLGEVSQPGAYTVSPSATLFSSLYYFKT